MATALITQLTVLQIMLTPVTMGMTLTYLIFPASS